MPGQLLAVSVLLIWLLPALSGAATNSVTIKSGQYIANVHVDLEGSGERLLTLPGDTVPPLYTYTATGTFTIEGEEEQEAEEKEIPETYSWSVGSAVIVSGGGSSDSSVTVMYNLGDESNNSISVTYTVEYSDTDSITVVVPTWDAGEPIACDGITSPSDGAIVPVGMGVLLAIDAPVDTDRRVGAETTEPDDTCIVTWTASVGTFDGASTGNSVTWIAPEEGQANISITATIIDEAIIPPREAGGRSDSPPPGTLKKSITVSAVAVTSLGCEGVVSSTATPGVAETVTLPLGYGGGGVLITAVSSLAGVWPDGQPVWTGAIGNGDGTALLSTLEAGSYVVTATCGTSTISIIVNVIEVAEIACEDIVSTTDSPTFFETVNIPVDTAGVTVTATPNPDLGVWPAGEPVWSGPVTTLTGPSTTLDTSVIGAYVVTASCGDSEVSLIVNIVGVFSVSSQGVTSRTDAPGGGETLNVPLGYSGGSVLVHAAPDPGSANFPEDQPVWSGDTSGTGITAAALSTATIGTYHARATCGTSSKALIMNVIKILSITSEGITSTTATPGNEQTINIPIGYNDGEITISAVSSLSGVWPSLRPEWNGVTTSSGPTAKLSTNAAGTYIITATCGNTVSLIVNVIEIEYVKARRNGSGEPYAAGAIIAAGAIPNSSHTADIEIKIRPVPTGPFSVTLPVTVANAQGYPVDRVDATFSIGGTVLVGNGTANVTFSNSNTSEGKCYGTLVSGNCINASPCTIGDATITFSWDRAGEYDFRYPIYFIPGLADDVSTFLTLDEVGDKDEDGDTVVGEGAIGGHSISYYTLSITVEYWKYNFITESYDQGPTTATFSIPFGSGPTDYTVVFGKTVNDLVLHGTTGEGPTGQYTNLQTVYDYAAVSEDGSTLEAIIVLEYHFAVMDNSCRYEP